MAQKIEKEDRQLTELLTNAQKLHEQGEITESLQLIKKLIVSKDRDIKRKALSILAMISETQKYHDKAIKFFNSALKLTDEDALFEQAQYLNKIGLIYRMKKEYERAIEYQEECLKKITTIGNKLAESVTLRNLGSLYSLVGRHVEALKSHQRSLEIKRTVGDVLEIAHTLFIYAQDLEFAGKFKEAIGKYEEALDVYEEVGDTKKIKEIEEAIERLEDEEDEQSSYEYHIHHYDML